MYPDTEILLDGFIRRQWDVRVKCTLPTQALLDQLAATLMSDVRVEMLKYLMDSAPIDLAIPRVRLLGLTSHTLIAEIEVPPPDRCYADADMLGTWLTLTGIDCRWTIQQLQGVPDSSWYPLQAARNKPEVK